MPLYDHRVFRHNDLWWVAEVCAASGKRFAMKHAGREVPAPASAAAPAGGASSTAESPDDPPNEVGLMMMDDPIISETVIFTCLNDRTAQSLRAQLRPNKLNRLSHAALVSVLERATPHGSRVDMLPYNPPNPDQYTFDHMFLDRENIRWGFAETMSVVVDETGTPACRPAIELTCLDDTALRETILLTGQASSVAQILDRTGIEGFPEIAELVKTLYLDLTTDVDDAA